MTFPNESRKGEWSRRNFLQTMGASVPTLSVALSSSAPRAAQGNQAPLNSGKFTPIDLAPYFNASPRDFGEHEQIRSRGGASARDGLLHTPSGSQTFRGIPFLLGAEGADRKSWIALSLRPSAWTSSRIEIPIGRPGGFLCLAAFCDWDPNETPLPGSDVTEKVGQRLATVVLAYEDGSEAQIPLRRRFEVNQTATGEHRCFVAEPPTFHVPSQLNDPLRNGLSWGGLQTSIENASYPSGSDGRPLAWVWISALPSPKPQTTIKMLRLEATAEDLLFICGLTLFHGQESPLRFKRLSLYRLTLPEPVAEDPKRWEVSLDLGVVTRKYAPAEFNAQDWLAAPDVGLGEVLKPTPHNRHLYVEITASPEATLALLDHKTGQRYEFDLHNVQPGRELEARPAGARVEILEPEKVWVRGQVVDSATRKPTAVRLAFRSKEGRYIPPYGHRTEINDGWFQDYGADLKLMDASFAYLDGTFLAELPVGEVYVELSKGFEFLPTRQKLEIKPGQNALTLEISRLVDLRRQGWVTADTHVHFLSPSTAVLEGQAEGLNLINLLAAQWGDLFTNVGDLPHGALTSKDGEMVVQVSSENRQHILGHLGLLGVRNEPAYPMSASGPGESYMGDPLWKSLADWADMCRERKGLVVAVHFPYPTAELAADIALGKIEAVELHPRKQEFNALPYLEWYRYLNCGYRLPVVGGTDKMYAYMPVGANRTYAYLGQEEFNFDNWAKAVRRGNTFSTSGPLVLFKADGHPPGEEILLKSGGGTVEVEIVARGFVPFHRLEVVLNGKVVASQQEPSGKREMILRDKVKVDGPGWLAARCSSRLGPTTAWQLAVVAHTSPVYMSTPGRDLFSPATATYMLTLIDGTQAWVEDLAIRPDAETLARIRATLNEARERLHHRMHAHGMTH